MSETSNKDCGKGVSELKIAEQKEIDGSLFPLILGTESFKDLNSALEWVKNQRSTVDDLLVKNGAIFFRGFPIQTPQDFDTFVKAFGGEPLEYVGGAAPRTVVYGNVFTANEAPPDQLIPFHHEMAQVPTFPSRLFFYCDVAPPVGGQTPIALSHAVYRRMLQKRPDFVARLEKEGVSLR